MAAQRRCCSLPTLAIGRLTAIHESACVKHCAQNSQQVSSEFMAGGGSNELSKRPLAHYVRGLCSCRRSGLGARLIGGWVGPSRHTNASALMRAESLQPCGLLCCPA